MSPARRLLLLVLVPAFVLILLIPSNFALALQVEASPSEIPSPTETAPLPLDTPTPLESPTQVQLPSETPIETPPSPSETPTETAPVPSETPTETAPPPTETPTDTPTATETAVPSDTPSPTTTPTRLTQDPLDEPKLSAVLNLLADRYRVGGAAAAADLSEAGHLSLSKANENVQVVAMLAADGSLHDARQLVASLSGWIEADSGNLIQIDLPIKNLRALAADDVFAGVRTPAYAKELAGPLNSEGVVTSGANAWHQVGITGKGVKVAVLDLGFVSYTTLLGTELPPTSRIHARSFTQDGSVLGWTSHGTAVAETLYDMAPGIELWLVRISTDVEFAEAMDWLIQEGVQVINASFGWTSYDVGDGTGFLVDSVNRANAAGVLPVFAAGNEAQGHYEGGFTAESSYHDWIPGAGVDTFNRLDLGFTPAAGECYWLGSLMWDDWGDQAPGVDYDVEVYEDWGFGWVDVTLFINDQESGFPWPYEDGVFCSVAGGQVAIRVFNFSGGTAGDYFEWYGWPFLQYGESASSSLAAPADTASAFTVGAADWFTGALEPYSSRGPVNGPGAGQPTGGEAIKPDITGPDCTTTNRYGLSGFCGTSAAAPHVSGAAALVWQAHPDWTNAQVRDYLETTAEADIGDPTSGKDNLWGWGRLKLGALPPGPPACGLGDTDCVGGIWPLFQTDPARTGRGSGTVAPDAALLWTAGLGANVRSVVIGALISDTWPDGLAHVVAGRYVYGVDPNRGLQAWSDQSGEPLQWKFDLGAAGAATGPAAPAATWDDGGTPGDSSDDSYVIYVGSGDGYVYKLDGIDGDWVDFNEGDSSTWGLQPVCKSADLGTNLSKASPLIGADGTVYFVDDAAVDRLIAVNPDCTQKWSIDLGPGTGTSSPAYWANPANPGTVDDLIFVGADKLYAITIWGGIKWAQPLKTGAETATVPSTPVALNINNTGRAYAVNSLGDLYTVEANTGIVQRVFDAPAGVHGLGSLLANYYTPWQANIYWGHLAVLYRYDTNAPGFATALTLGGSLSDASPVMDASGNVFIGSSDGRVYGVDGWNMTALSGWPRVAGGSTAVGLAISPLDGVLYVPSSDGNLRAYGGLPGGCPTCVLDPQSDWPEFQRNLSNTGAGAQTLSTTPTLLWNRAPGGDVFPPVVGEFGLTDHPQGIAYFVTGRFVRAIDLETRLLLWSYDLGAAGTPLGFAAPAVVDQTGEATYFDDGVVFVGGKDGFLHAINPLFGFAIWKTDVGLDISKASPTIGDDGTIYVVEDAAVDRLIAVAHTGAVRWSAPIGAALGTSAPAYDSASDCVFVGGKNLYGFDSSGAVCPGWTAGGVQLGGATTTVPAAPLIAGSNVYALNSLGDLYSVPLAGGAASLVYDAPAATGLGSPAFDVGGGAGGYLYWTLGGKLYRWDIAGASAAAITLSGTTANSTPAIDASGAVFVGTSDNKLWRLARGSTTPSVIHVAAGSLSSAGAITHNPQGGVLLWPSADDNLYAFGTPEGSCATCGLASGYWPMFQGNPTHDPGAHSAGGTNTREARSYTVAGAVRPPVMDEANGRLYFVAGQYLYARNAWVEEPGWWTGGVEKKYNLGVAVTANAYGMPALARDTSREDWDELIIFVGGADGVLHAVRAATGDLLWKADVGNNISKASPAVSDGGFLFVVEDNASPALDRLIALDFKGSVVWYRPIGNSDGTSSPAINDNFTPGDPTDDTVLVGGGGGLYAFRATDGSTPAGWGSTLTPIGATNGAPVVMRLDPVSPYFDAYYVVTKAGELVRAVNDTAFEVLADVPGTSKSAAPFVGAFCNDGSDPCTGGWHTRISFGVGNTLYQYIHGDPWEDGILRSVVLGGDLGDSTPLSGDGAVYIGSTDQKFYAVESVWWLTGIGWASPPTGGGLAGAGAFTQQWTLVWPGQNGKLHFFEYGGGDPAASDGAVGQWPLFQRSSHHLGMSPSAIPANPVEQWAVLGAGDAKPAVIGEINQPFNDGTYPDGITYFVAGRYLYALDLRTHLIVKKWDLGSTSGVSGYSSPAVIRLDPQDTPGDPNDDEVRIIVADKSGFVKATGSWWWEDDHGWWDGVWNMLDVGLDASKASPLAGRNNLVYVVEDAAIDRLHAIQYHWNAAIAWTTPLGAGPGSSSPAYYDGSPDRVFVGANSLYAVNANTGSILWSRSLGSPIGSSPLVIDLAGTANDAAYVLTTAAKMYRIPVTGGPSSPTPLVSSIVGTVGAGSMAAYEYDVANDYFYLFFGVGNKLYRYDTNGGALTNIALGTLATNFTNSTPLVDVSNQVFIGGADGWLYGIDGSSMAALAPAWNPADGGGWPKRIGLGSAASSAAGSLAMDADGYLYVPSLDDNLRRFGPAVPVACSDCDLYTEAQWPMFQHDRGHTGVNPVGAGHRTPIVYWTRTNPAPFTPPRTAVLGPPTTDYPGGALIYTSGQFVFAREAGGLIRWAFDLGVAGNPSGGASPALVLRDDNNTLDCPNTMAHCDDDTIWMVVGAKDGFLYALNAYPTDIVDQMSQEMIWRIDLGGDISKASPAVGPDGTIYAVEDATPNDLLHAVYWNGTRRWTQTLGAGTGASSPAIDLASNRIFVGSANKIYAFDLTTGAPLSGWPIQIGTVGLVNTTPVLFNNDLWLLNSVGDLYRLEPSIGAQVPQLAYGDAVGAIGDGVAPALQDDPYTGDEVIVFGVGTRFYHIRWDTGSNDWVTWQWLATKGTAGTSSATIDDNGWSYIFDSAGYLTAFYRYGPWWAPTVFSKKIATQGTLAGGIVISNDGMLFVPSRNNTFYGLGAP